MGEDSIYPLVSSDPKISKECVTKIHLANKKFRRTKNVLKSIRIQEDYMASKNS